MDGVSKEIIGIIYQLLPGFIVAWIVYGLTSHLKPSSFERIVQALIFTVLVKTLLILFKMSIFAVGSKYSVGVWSGDLEFVWSIIIAITSGLVITWCVNNDFPLFLFRAGAEGKCHKYLKWLNRLLSKINLTNKTLHPTEWFSAFNRDSRYIVLHLSGERRLRGWPEQYPDDPQKGHFLISEAIWLLDDGSSAPLYNVKHVLVPSTEVEHIEFLKADSEITASAEDIQRANTLLINLYKQEANDVNECSETTTVTTTAAN